MQIKIKTALAHEPQRDSDDAKRELEAIQEYVNKNVLHLEEETIYFIPLQGNYVHVKRTMLFVGVIISTMKGSIQGVTGCLETQLKEYEAEVAKIKFEFPPKFVGRLNHAQGFPVHFEVPVKGLKEDMQITSSSFNCELTDVKVLRIDDMEGENEKN